MLSHGASLLVHSCFLVLIITVNRYILLISLGHIFRFRIVESKKFFSFRDLDLFPPLMVLILSVSAEVRLIQSGSELVACFSMIIVMNHFIYHFWHLQKMF